MLKYEDIKKIRLGDYYWLIDGFALIQVKVVSFSMYEEEYYHVYVTHVPEPQYYNWSVDVRLLYRTKEDALTELRKKLIKEIKETKDKIIRFEDYLNQVEEELKESI